MEPCATAQAAFPWGQPCTDLFLFPLNASSIPTGTTSGGPAFSMSMGVYRNSESSKYSGLIPDTQPT